MEMKTGDTFVKQVWGSAKMAVFASGAAMLFGLAVLVLSIFAAVSPMAVSPHEDASSGGILVQKVNYYLPYPGLLPDSRLYKFKMLRDRVALWLTAGEEGKARKELAYADKRIGAAMVLLDGGKANLAVTTAVKAEKYLEQAVGRVERLTREGRDVKSLLLVMGDACAKHEELLSDMTTKLSGTEKDMAGRALELASTLHERVDQAKREAK